MPSTPPKSSLHFHRINNSTLSQKSSASLPSPNTLNSITCFCLPGDSIAIPDTIACYHNHDVLSNQCCSVVVQTISAPVSTVWSVVRRFDNPQAYKNFVKSCDVIVGDGNVGTLRKVHIVSGLPAETSTERLDILDDEHHVLSFSVVGGEHRLCNYRSVTTLHPSSTSGTIVVESYTVDIPPGNTKEDTCLFVDTIVRCNLRSLSRIAENLAAEEKKDFAA